MKITPLPTAERLVELFVYDPETGNVTSRVKRGKIWPKQIMGSLDGYGYLILTVDFKFYKLHRIIWKLVTGEDPKHSIDHVDGNPANNKLSNLREANKSQNMQNCVTRKDNTTGYKGVNPTPSSWEARITSNGVRFQKSGFATAHEAYLWRCGQLSHIHGEFAHDGKPSQKTLT